ncbi:Protein-glutamate methylesterase/protein-glutamine glutaminase [Dyadobacter sp. CECT 9275]|uniref:Protein-glutamate methylesterase/protein-glutamine glutaminase n=1 Tax=Dyadobacter helix TaxID=2822344 RepID=A0A916JBZ1_9BACT|nr:response regulator [Dyadobacter sp. CECT 9275]CAG4998940.1 Protein-glutamate methylesterase/protein-glutamine glutaminase [Dyadobacter sp. CECT 9275]
MIPFTDSPQKVKKILFVEDNLFFRKVVSASLAKASYDVFTAASASEALRILKEDEPDLILSDYDMPEMNGFGFRQEVLRHSNLKDIPFVFLTSFTDSTLVLEGLNMNAIDFINKETPIPVIVSKLSNIIRSLETEHLRSVKELRIAAEAINVKSVPALSPQLNGFRIFFWHKGFRGYPGGDFIDFVKVNDRYCFALLGDIMGKKWKAWFFTFGFLSYIRAAIRFCVLDDDFSLSNIVHKINKLICLDESLQNILSSLSLLLIDCEKNTIKYTGAGDLPLVNYKEEGGTTSTVISQGLLLGLLEDGFYDEQTVTMQSGDKLAIFTDGMIDIPSNGTKKSDYPFFVSKIRPFLSEKESFNLIRSNILAQINDGNQMDDASIIFIEKL